MFVALVLYTSANGFENKLYAPARVVQTTEDGYKIRRFTAFPTLEEAQAALSEDTNSETPFTPSILENGYRRVIVDVTSGTVVENTVVAAVPQTESAAVQAN